MRKLGIVVATVMSAALVVSCMTQAASTLPVKIENVAVDLSQALGPSTGRASGFLHSMSASKPGPELVEAIKPMLFRMWGPDFSKDGTGAWATYDRVQAMGARMQVVMSDSQGYGAAGWWPSDAGAMQKWDAIVDGLLALAKSNNATVEWDIWNEPNSGDFWGRPRSDFFGTWRHTVRRMRKQLPSAVIVGPSISGYDQEWLESFLLYAKDNDVMPDKVSWHEFGAPGSIPGHVASIRQFMRSEDMGARPISLNEVMNQQQTLLPGPTVQYFANLERAMVDGACHACWGEPGNVNACANYSLDGILTADRKPRSVWWAYKVYSELTGGIVPVLSSQTIDGIAAVDAERHTVGILLGRNGSGQGPVTVSIAHIKAVSFFSEDSAVTVIGELIPASGLNALPAPITVLQLDVRVDEDHLAIEIQGLGAHDACWITVRPSEGGSH